MNNLRKGLLFFSSFALIFGIYYIIEYTKTSKLDKEKKTQLLIGSIVLFGSCVILLICAYFAK